MKKRAFLIVALALLLAMASGCNVAGSGNGRADYGNDRADYGNHYGGHGGHSH